MKTGITIALAAVGALGGSSMASGFHVPFLAGGYAPTAQCVQWYNGCNMCTKESDGIVSCTNRICQSTGKGFCQQYASSTPAVS